MDTKFLEGLTVECLLAEVNKLNAEIGRLNAVIDGMQKTINFSNMELVQRRAAQAARDAKRNEGMIDVSKDW